jgi:hypothetical protein
MVPVNSPDGLPSFVPSRESDRIAVNRPFDREFIGLPGNLVAARF